MGDLRCPELVSFFVSAKSLVRGFLHPQALIAAPTSVTVGCGACGDTASSWHSTTSLNRCALQVRLHRLWLRVVIVGTGRIADFAPLVALSPLLAFQNHNNLLTVTAASDYSATATSRWPVVGRRGSWTFTSCSPCMCVTENQPTVGARCPYYAGHTVPVTPVGCTPQLASTRKT